jgi:pSer/pThr/pTyr-binding forkhead associated (FHA) protein
VSNKDSRVEGRPRGSALLVVKRGPTPVPGSCWISPSHPPAGADNDIVLDDITVSEHHAEFRRENRKFQVVDVDSFLTTSTTA